MEGGPPAFSADSSCPQILRIHTFRSAFHLHDSHILRSAFPCRSVTLCGILYVLTPQALLPAVWPLPISLATTLGISFDFSSSGYLDVSVPRVPSAILFDSDDGHSLFGCVVPQFGYPRINVYLLLPAAFRSLSRPSSAPDAKAFTLCSFSLEQSSDSFESGSRVL